MFINKSLVMKLLKNKPIINCLSNLETSHEVIEPHLNQIKNYLSIL